MSDSIKITLKKNHLKLLIIALVILLGLCFIPFEKKVNSSKYEKLDKYSNAISYSYKLYDHSGECLYDARVESGDDDDLFHKMSKKCLRDTGIIANAVKFSNGSCNNKDYGAGIKKLENCEIFFIKNGSLYEDLNFNEEYKYKVDIEITSGSSIEVEHYLALTCRLFGLICSSENPLDENTHSHTRLIVGKNAKIDRYPTLCDWNSNRAIKDGEVCVYEDEKPRSITIEELLRL